VTRRAGATLALLLTIFAGCTVGPNYKPPATQVPEQYGPPATQPATQPAGEPPDLADWWTTLKDPLLDSLIERAIASNLDLRVAEARVREARSQRAVTASGLWPQVNVNDAYRYKGTSENANPKQKTTGTTGGLQGFGKLPGITILPGTGATTPTIMINTQGEQTDNSSTSGLFNLFRQPSGVERTQNLFQAGFDATWEIDVFGGVRRAIEAAEADIQVAEENRRYVLVTLLSEVARNYIEARANQRRLDIVHGNIRSQADTLELTRTRFNAGLTSELDVAQAESQLASTQSQVPLLDILLRQAIHRLGVLLGQPPESLLEELNQDTPLPTIPPEIPLGLPSELLLRRPDIRRSERELAAATARIGVATAELFPRFSLTGSFGTQTDDMQHFLDRKSLFWSVGPNMSWPIFDAGRIRANIDVQDARQQQALALFQQTILTALEDVENTVVAYRQEQVRHRYLASAVQANRRAFQLANERYTKGLADFLSVLESQRSLYITEDALVQSEGQAVTNLIALYKALGGGWEVQSSPR